MYHVEAHERQELVDPASRLACTGAAVSITHPHHAPARGGEESILRYVGVGSHAHLHEIIFALRPPHRLANRVDGRQEQAHQDAENGDDDEQLDQRKTV